MREDIEKRALEIGHYIVEKSATVRQTASVFRVSKSTVHTEVINWNGLYGRYSKKPM